MEYKILFFLTLYIYNKNFYTNDHCYESINNENNDHCYESINNENNDHCYEPINNQNILLEQENLLEINNTLTNNQSLIHRFLHNNINNPMVYNGLVIIFYFITIFFILLSIWGIFLSGIFNDWDKFDENLADNHWKYKNKTSIIIYVLLNLIYYIITFKLLLFCITEKTYPHTLIVNDQYILYYISWLLAPFIIYGIWHCLKEYWIGEIQQLTPNQWKILYNKHHKKHK